MDKSVFMKCIVLLSTVIAGILVLAPTAFAIDSPHALVDSVDCGDCHTGHAAPGPSLTDDADNANLCMSCHTSGGLANNKRLSSAMQADTGAMTGTSHRWDSSIATDAEGGSLGLVVGNANNKHGLVPCDDTDCTAITNTTLKLRLRIFNYKVTCSVLMTT
jgi:predicted CXXCH cytochrome family protein